MDTRQKTANVLILFFASIVTLLFSCKKTSKDNEKQNKNSLVLFSNTGDSLLGIFNWVDKGLEYNLYGTQDANGKITKINSIACYFSSNKDTVYNFNLDDSGRVSTYFRTIKDNKDSVFFRYTYHDSLTSISMFKANWNSNKAILLQVAASVNNVNLIANSYINYRIENTYDVKENKELIINAITGILTAVTIVGLLPEIVTIVPASHLLIMITAYYGTVGREELKQGLKRILGVIDAVINSIIETVLDKIPDDVFLKNKPTLGLSGFFQGNIPTSGLVPFADTGSPYCTYTVEYSNTDINILFNESSGSIITSDIFTHMEEAVVSCNHGITPPHNNHYGMSQFEINGQQITIYYRDENTNYPPNNVSFSGTIDNGIIKGKITLIRTSYPPAFVSLNTYISHVN